VGSRIVRVMVVLAAMGGTAVTAQTWLPGGPALAAGSGRSPGAVELLPNLQAFPATDLTVQVSPGGRRALRLAAQVADAGIGPLEVYPIADDCNDNGDYTDDRSGYQRTFADMDGDGVFTRGVDVKQTSRFAGCFFFHPQHNHWHFEDWARYDLARLSDGVVVASGGKTSFCIADTDRAYPAIPGSPPLPYYGLTCRPDDTEGLSVGWSDTYSAGLAGQKIPVTRVPNGNYCLIVTADPDDLLVESDETDNRGTVPVRLQGPTVTVIGSSC
jgi:hypothetical protein